MKIAILTELFPPSVGGQENRFAELSQVLSRRGHAIEIFCIQSDRESEAYETLGDVTVHRYPLAPDYQQPACKWFRRQPSVMLRYALWCRNIDPQSFDLFIFNQWPLAHLILAPVSIRSKALTDWCEFRAGAPFTFLQKYLPARVAGNITNSTSLARRFEVSSGSHFSVLPSGIFTSRYRCKPKEQRKGALYLGRIAEHKNLGLLLSCYKSLVARGYDGPLRIAGSGPSVTSLQELRESSGISDRVELLGAVAEEEKVELLASSDLLVLTSRREGFARVIAEAMASGLPVVTVDYPENGAKEVVQEYGIGLVTEPRASALSDGMVQVLQKWDFYSAVCISASKSLDWEVVADHLLRITARILRLS